MRKIRIIFLSVVTLFVLFGCDNNVESNNKDNKTRENQALKNNINNQDNPASEKSEDINTSTDNEITNQNIKTNENSNVNENNVNVLNQIFIVKFDLNGGTKYVTYERNNPYSYSYSLTVKNGDTYGSASANKRLPNAIRDGYIFSGWYTTKNGDGKKVTEDSIVNLKSNIELYAYWKESIRINYECVGSRACTSGAVYIEKGMKVSDFKIKYDISFINVSGYDFNGLFINLDCTQTIQDDHAFIDEEKIYIKHTPIIHSVYVKAIGNGQIFVKNNTVSTDGYAELELMPEDGYIPYKYKVCHEQFDNPSGCQEWGVTFNNPPYIYGSNYTEAGGEGDLYISFSFVSKE